MVESTLSSYLPLYRKYRPQTFNDLVGQEAVAKILSSAIEINKVSHAYLFTGSRGTGKTSSARIFAKSLNCVKGPTSSPCGVCPSCIDIAAGRAVDVIEIDAASNRSVEHARNILEKVHFAPVSGKYKVYIIDEVHMLSKDAFNTLLKTLEEPPKNLVFILATTEAHKVLETIVSRCQKFDFKRIKTDLIVNRLKNISELENINISDDALSIIARRSAGGLRDALSLLDQVSILSLTGKKIEEEDVLQMLGSLSDDVLFEITKALAERNPQSLLKCIDYLFEKGNEPVQIIRELMGYFRNLMLAKTSTSYEQVKELIITGEPFFIKLKQQTEYFEVIEITQIIDKLAECERALKNSSQQALWLEAGLISICHRHDIQLVKDLQQRIEKLEKIVLSGQIPVPATKVKLDIPNDICPKIKPEVIESPVKQAEPKAAYSINQNEKSAQNLKNEEKLINENPIDKKTELKNEEKVSDDLPAVVSSASKDDLMQNWKTLLKNIPSPPTMSLFMQLSTPVEITSERIIVTFKDDIWVKKIQDEGKADMLLKAATIVFGKTPKLVIRTPLPEDKKNLKTEAINKTENLKPITKKISNVDNPQPQEGVQITSNIVDEPSQRVIKRADEVKNTKTADAPDEELEDIEIAPPQVTRTNLPEAATHILNVFNGKIIE